MRGFMIFVIYVALIVITTFVLKRRWGLAGSLASYPLATRLKVAYPAVFWPITLPVLLLAQQSVAKKAADQKSALNDLLDSPDSSAHQDPDIPFGATPPNDPKPHNPFGD